MSALANVANMSDFYLSLEIMGFGMTGIFVVLSLLFISVKALIKFFPEK